MAGRLAALQAELPPGCRLLAVSKGQPSGRIREAVAAGQRSFGESRLQEAVLKQFATQTVFEIKGLIGTAGSGKHAKFM